MSTDSHTGSGLRPVILTDEGDVRANLLPLTYTRPTACLRAGILTFAERWRAFLPGEYRHETAEYLRTKFPCFDGAVAEAPDTIRVAGNVVADADIASAVLELKSGQSLWSGDTFVARRGDGAERCEYAGAVTAVKMVYDIFLMNDEVLRADFRLLASGQPRREVSSTVTVIGDPADLFIHADAGDVEGCVINVRKGPVYIGPGAEVMEGALMRGPVAVCGHAVVKMGAKIYGATTIGPWCKVGGELSNVVMTGYSNKAHDGFLGNAVIGEWCNLGGGCTASNLKNDYTEIRLWNYPARRFLRTGLQFCGLIMGDHSKAGVNTMLNTATVLGVGVNIHGSGFPRPFLASFTEGSPAGYTDVPMAKFFETARKVMARRGLELTQADIDILTHIREYAEQFR